MSRIVRSPISRLNVMWLALAVGGCAVIGSAPTYVDEPRAGCVSTLGSYSLPKTVLNFKIRKDITKPDYFLQPIGIERVPDNQHTFCLDFLRSALSSDEVRVFKNKITATMADVSGQKIGETQVQKRKVTSIEPDSTPFLQLVASKAVDHTAGIIRRIIRVAFTLLSNKGSARSSAGINEDQDGLKTVVIADFQVDPFDYQEMARVNEATRKYGFCFVLEDYTFERTAMSAHQYCGTPDRSVAQTPPHTAEPIQRLHYLVPRPVDGIFFRPRAAYRLSVYIKDDPGGRGPWRLGHIKNFQMENIMPIVSVGISRAIFATRRTGLVFDDGTLTNVCISKGSEIEGAIRIPLDVIYGIIALPSETLLAAINDTNTTKDLLAAQKRLVEAQNQYINFLNKDKSTFTQINHDTEQQKKRGKLTLESTAGTPFPEDEPPDAGQIYRTDAAADALSEICAELANTKSFDFGPKDATTGKKPLVQGSF